MIAAVLSTEYKTYKTQGNYNNEIGLPYTALHMPDDTEKIVLEMGQDHMGDIHLLSELAKPHYRCGDFDLVKLIWNFSVVVRKSQKVNCKLLMAWIQMAF